MRRTLIIIASWIAIIFLGRLTAAQEKYWHWTPDGVHHDAIVSLQFERAGGTGILISNTGGVGYIVTAAHVPGRVRSGVATWPDRGHKARVTVVRADHASDVAICSVQPPPNAQVIPVAVTPPPAGAYMELAGYGGPDAPLRHWWGQAIDPRGSEYGIQAKTTVISGDSGGAFIYQGQLVGVISGGPHRGRGVQARRGGIWNLVYPASGASCLAVRRLCGG